MKITRQILNHVFWLSVFLFTTAAQSAVILQYHHVSTSLPRVTSLSSEEFRAHLEHLKTENYQVVPLDTLLSQLQNGETPALNTVAITFDDGYDNNYDAAAPILEEYGYPYTIFVNPKLIDEGKSYVMTWEQLRTLAKKGALIANHSAEHNYLHQYLTGETREQWLARTKKDILDSEKRIKEEVGHNAKILAYPYGEFNRDLQALVKELGFIGIGQHSGAISKYSDFTRLPRFPASGRYANLDTLKTKIAALPFNIKAIDYQDTITENTQPQVRYQFDGKDFYQSQFACFASGQGRAEIEWQDDLVSVKSPAALGKGRARYNCTAPSKTHAGRYYWLSQPWVITVQ